MTKLDTPDLCARLDRLKGLCDRLEDAQSNPRRYRELVQQIRRENRSLPRNDLWCARFYPSVTAAFRTGASQLRTEPTVLRFDE
jgi:hypothetical protein